MPSITPCLTFNDRCEEAVRFYVKLFGKNSRILTLVRSEGDGPIPKGKVSLCSFKLAGQEFAAFDGGDPFTFAMGNSLMVQCKNQKEIDHFYEGLAEGGERQPCGWLKDRFGLSWQVIPEKMDKMLTDAKHGDTQAAMQAMLKMEKLDLATLEGAYRGGAKPKARAKAARRR